VGRAVVRIQKVEEEIRKEQKRQTALQIERDSLLSLETLEESAKKKLGLVEPKEENIVIMTLKDGGK
jgi:cell division protein FtsL